MSCPGGARLAEEGETAPRSLKCCSEWEICWHANMLPPLQRHEPSRCILIAPRSPWRCSDAPAAKRQRLGE